MLGVLATGLMKVVGSMRDLHPVSPLDSPVCLCSQGGGGRTLYIAMATALHKISQTFYPMGILPSF